MILNVLTAAVFAGILCGQCADMLGGNEQRTTLVPITQQFISRQNLYAVNRNPENLGGAVGIHAKSWAPFYCAAGGASHGRNLAALLGRGKDASITAYGAIGALASTRYLPPAQHLRSTNPQHCATIALTAPVCLSEAVGPGEVLDLQTSKTAAYKRSAVHRSIVTRGGFGMDPMPVLEGY